MLYRRSTIKSLSIHDRGCRPETMVSTMSGARKARQVPLYIAHSTSLTASKIVGRPRRTGSEQFSPVMGKRHRAQQGPVGPTLLRIVPIKRNDRLAARGELHSNGQLDHPASDFELADQDRIETTSRSRSSDFRNDSGMFPRAISYLV